MPEPIIEIRETEPFSDWLNGIRDARTKAKIVARVRRLAFGNPGDVKPVGSGVSEMRIDHGPGYRIYMIRRGDRLIILLGGGEKASQAKDIDKAKRLAAEIEE